MNEKVKLETALREALDRESREPLPAGDDALAELLAAAGGAEDPRLAADLELLGSSCRFPEEDQISDDEIAADLRFLRTRLAPPTGGDPPG